MTIRELLQADNAADNITIRGWVRTRRDSKEFSFMELNDGSCLANIQVIINAAAPAYSGLAAVTTGAAVAVTGKLVESPGKGQSWEIQADNIKLIGECPSDYPLQKKRHSDEYLRTIAHLRPRTNKFSAVARIRSRLSWAIHDFLQQRGFHYIHTPIITGSDCEGAGEMFQVTTLDLNSVARAGQQVDFGEDFFGKPAHLTVSGQLSLETYCLGLSKVYSFGPTFRSENSNTSRHMAEFWMIEPEIAFADLDQNIDLAESMVESLVAFALDDCAEDIALFAKFVDKDLLPRLESVRRR